MNIKKILTGSAIGIGTVLMTAVTVFAATLVVLPSNNQGWVFNPDPANSTPYEFNASEPSIGAGSLFVEPISSTPAHKFIAAKVLNTPVSDVNSLAYDFMIAGAGNVSDANQFYMNVYANIDDSTNFYDCRFDYVAITGSTSSFETHQINVDDLPTNVAKRGTRITTSCPATLSGMPTGSYVRAIAINVGDTSANDTGLAGYLDNVVVNLDSGETVYDFEPALTPGSDKNACKDGGWKSFNTPSFKNQGACVSYVQSNEHANKRLNSFNANDSLYYNCPVACASIYASGPINFTWDEVGNVTGGTYNEVVPATTGTTYYNAITGGTVIGNTVNLTLSRTVPNTYGPFYFTGTLSGNVLSGLLDGPYFFTATGN